MSAVAVAAMNMAAEPAVVVAEEDTAYRNAPPGFLRQEEWIEFSYCWEAICRRLLGKVAYYKTREGKTISAFEMEKHKGRRVETVE